MFTAKHAACACALAVVAMCIAVHAEDEPGVVLLPVCSSDAIADVHRRASPAMVVVRAPGVRGLPQSGVGFVFGSRRYVATAFSLVENGRGIEVIVDGEERDALVVAVNRVNDVAIVRLERAATVPPLVAARNRIPVGEPVLTLRRSDDSDTADVVIDAGIVTAAKDRHLRTNVELTQGGPVLDCAGEVVGVATNDGVALARTLDDLLGTIDPSAERYASGWSLWHPMITFHGQLGAAPSRGQERPDGWLGVGLGTALIGDDRWYFPFEARALWLLGPDSVNPLVERRGMRLQLAAAAGYRFLIAGGDMPTYLIPTIGAVLSYDEIITRGSELALDGCPGRCQLAAIPFERVDALVRLMPTIGLKLQLGFGTVGYELAFDVTTPGHSVHQLTAGFQF